VVATVRADFYDRLISHQKVRALLPTQQVLLGAMSRAELESTLPRASPNTYRSRWSHQKVRALLPTQQVLLGAMSRAELESTLPRASPNTYRSRWMDR
jgi:hypothetical protein